MSHELRRQRAYDWLGPIEIAIARHIARLEAQDTSGMLEADLAEHKARLQAAGRYTAQGDRRAQYAKDISLQLCADPRLTDAELALAAPTDEILDRVVRLAFDAWGAVKLRGGIL